jgi:ABC-2 type transport system permease protein
VTRAGALAHRIILAFRHDRRTLGLVVMVPLIVMALIGYLVGDDKEPLRVGVVTPEITPGSGAAPALRFADALDAEPAIVVVEVDDEDTGRRQVDEGDTAALVITSAGAPGPDSALPPVTIVVRGEDVQVEAPIVQAAARAVAAAQGRQVPAGGVPGLEIERIALSSGERPSTISFAAPAMVTTFAFLFTFMLTSVAFLRERSSGTLDRLLASPITRWEILAGYLGGFLPFAAIQSALVLGYAIVVLDATVAGSIWLVVLVLLLLVIGVVNLGIALSFFARNELQVIQFIPLVLLPQIFLGGLFWPVQTLWEPLTWLSILFPVTHAVHALRQVMLGGAGIERIATDLWALLGFAAAMVLLGVLVLRRQRA